MTLLTWDSTVRPCTTNRYTMAWFDRPSAISASTCLRPGLDAVAKILTTTPGVPLGPEWTDVRFRGGSEPGVLFVACDCSGTTGGCSWWRAARRTPPRGDQRHPGGQRARCRRRLRAALTCTCADLGRALPALPLGRVLSVTAFGDAGAVPVTVGEMTTFRSAVGRTSVDSPPAERSAKPAERAANDIPGLWPYAALFTVLLLWGFGPPLSKLISAPPLTASFVRSWSSTVAILALQMLKGDRPTWPALKKGFVGGVAFGANSLCFFIALRNASIATITVIGALQPGIVMLAASKLFGERMSRAVLGFTAVAVSGAALAVLGAGAKVHTNTVGILCSVGSLLCMSVYFLASKRARVTLSAGEYVMGVMMWAAIFVTPIVFLGGGLTHFDAIGRGDVFWLTVMLIGPGVGGQLLMGWSLRWVPVSLSAMILLGSTAVSIVAAWPIHGEVPTVLQLVGGGVALASVAAILRTART